MSISFSELDKRYSPILPYILQVEMLGNKESQAFKEVFLNAWEQADFNLLKAFYFLGRNKVSQEIRLEKSRIVRLASVLAKFKPIRQEMKDFNQICRIEKKNFQNYFEKLQKLDPKFAQQFQISRPKTPPAPNENILPENKETVRPRAALGPRQFLAQPKTPPVPNENVPPGNQETLRPRAALGPRQFLAPIQPTHQQGLQSSAAQAKPLPAPNQIAPVQKATLLKGPRQFLAPIQPTHRQGLQASATQAKSLPAPNQITPLRPKATLLKGPRQQPLAPIQSTHQQGLQASATQAKPLSAPNRIAPLRPNATLLKKPGQLLSAIQFRNLTLLASPTKAKQASARNQKREKTEV